MPKSVEYVVILADGVRKRHRHQIEKGEVVTFAVQLEVKVGDSWCPVVRYDCAHGVSHVDRYDGHGNKRTEPLNLSFDSALTYADWELNENWERYCRTFRERSDNE